MSASASSSLTLYRRLLGYVRPYWKAFLFSIIAMAITAATEPLLPWLLKDLLDGNFGKNVDDTALWAYPLGIVGLFLFRGVFSFISGYGLNWVSNRIISDVRTTMFDRLVRLPSRYYDNQAAGRLLSKVTNDVTGFTGAATSVLTVLVRDALTIVGQLSFLIYINWRMTLVTFIVFPAIALIVRLFGKRLRGLARGSQRAMGDMTQVLEESITAHKVVKIFGGQNYEIKRFRKSVDSLRGNNMRQAAAQEAMVPLVQFFAAIALGIVIFIALLQAKQGMTTVGSFVAFITAMLALLAPLKRLTDVNAPLQRGLASAESVFGLLDETEEEDRGSQLLSRASGHVEIRDLSFQYPETNRPALRNINLSIAPGETVALVGSSGSGKTTLANLLPRFYQHESGSITLDGIDTRDIKLESLRANIAFVSQDVVLFNDTVAANIAYGTMQGVDMVLVEEAAKAAYAHDFIMALPNGYQTDVGNNGVKLSGGQRQRIAIARALLKNAPVLILDEATSALDVESERQVQAALDKLMENRTTLVIAHRLSTIERADKIAVMDHGQIREQGNHQTLLAQNGLYANLYQMQSVLEKNS